MPKGLSVSSAGTAAGSLAVLVQRWVMLSSLAALEQHCVVVAAAAAAHMLEPPAGAGVVVVAVQAAFVAAPFSAVKQLVQAAEAARHLLGCRLDCGQEHQPMAAGEKFRAPLPFRPLGRAGRRCGRSNGH